jgi:hypothetical protein
MTLCDVCWQAKECTPRQIEGKEYDICAECGNPLEEPREEATGNGLPGAAEDRTTSNKAWTFRAADDLGRS